MKWIASRSETRLCVKDWLAKKGFHALEPGIWQILKWEWICGKSIQDSIWDAGKMGFHALHRESQINW